MEEVDSEILEILVVKVEQGEEVFSAEYVAAEEHRRILDITGGKTKYVLACRRG